MTMIERPFRHRPQCRSRSPVAMLFAACALVSLQGCGESDGGEGFDQNMDVALENAADMVAGPFSSASCMATCVMKRVGAAPCQWFSPGSKKTRSPGRMTSTGPPSRWQRPTPSVT